MENGKNSKLTTDTQTYRNERERMRKSTCSFTPLMEYDTSRLMTDRFEQRVSRIHRANTCGADFAQRIVYTSLHTRTYEVRRLHAYTG